VTIKKFFKLLEQTQHFQAENSTNEQS